MELCFSERCGELQLYSLPIRRRIKNKLATSSLRLRSTHQVERGTLWTDANESISSSATMFTALILSPPLPLSLSYELHALVDASARDSYLKKW